jgi:hypothetical protein
MPKSSKPQQPQSDDQTSQSSRSSKAFQSSPSWQPSQSFQQSESFQSSQPDADVIAHTISEVLNRQGLSETEAAAGELGSCFSFFSVVVEN